MIEFYLAMTALTGAFAYRSNPPKSPAEWLGLAGFAVFWPVLWAMLAYHIIRWGRK